MNDSTEAVPCKTPQALSHREESSRVQESGSQHLAYGLCFNAEGSLELTRKEPFGFLAVAVERPESWQLGLAGLGHAVLVSSCDVHGWTLRIM